MLEEYNYDIVYKPGIKNTNADLLSRITMTRISTVAENSSDYTKEERRKFCRNFMKSMVGHLGTNRTFERIKLYSSWPSMEQEIEDYIKHSDICQNKITQHKNKLP